MDETMAPPSKRRKLADSPSDSALSPDNSTTSPENLPSHAHAVESLSTHPPLAPPWTTSSGDTEQPTRISHPAVGGIEDFKVLIPRQGTFLNSVDSAVNSVISSVTSYVSALESISILISASATFPAQSVLLGALTSGETTSTSSTLTATTSVSSSQSSSSDSSASSSTTSVSSSNDTSTSVTASSSSPTGLPTFSANSTSALGNASSSRTTSTGTQTTSTTSIGSAFILVTLSNGDVSTISRQTGSFTTTFQDGEVFNIPAISALSTRSSSSLSTTSTISATESSETSSSAASSDIEMSTVTAIATVGIAGTAGQGTPTYPATTASTTSSSSDNGGDNNSSTPPAGTIAGGVVGGAAGLAVVLLLAMLFVRWYRRKGQMRHQALPPGSINSPDGDGAPDTSRGPGMAERAGLTPIIAALPAIFRHQNRSVEGSEPSERGFTRVSGRKLPSAFSEGMSSEAMSTPGMSHRPPPQMPPRSPGPESNLGEASFYQDNDGFYGGFGEEARSVSLNSPSSDVPIRNSGPELMTMSPGPQRQPQIHSGGPYTMSPTTSDVPTAATFERSETPASLRNSRFTEDM